ncbi:MAG: hypothetical protein HC824_11915, partial [Synechococcales cyanobacterium RM1_1_8]|nr:hypothetical protein [Synechococcales cyanobacterium RM1_1_8]
MARAIGWTLTVLALLAVARLASALTVFYFSEWIDSDYIYPHTFAVDVLRGLLGVHRSIDRFGQVAAAGLIGQIGVQAVINMAVNLNLMPTQRHDP